MIKVLVIIVKIVKSAKHLRTVSKQKKFGLAFKLQVENTREYFLRYFQNKMEIRIRSVSMRNDMWYFVANLPSKKKKNTYYMIGEKTIIKYKIRCLFSVYFDLSLN